MGQRPDLYDETATLIEERPEFESLLERLLEVDSEGPWEFDDIPLDSGQFGEVVSREIVREVEGGYRVADSDVVETALRDDLPRERSLLTSSVRDGLPEFDATVVLLFALVVLGTVVIRTAVIQGSVFRGGDIVLAGNDPYYYRYQVEQLVRGDLPAFDPGVLSTLPATVRGDEMLFVVVMWWLSALLGGDAQAVGLVLAWYPVVVAIATIGGVYLLTTWVFEDIRIGLSAAGLLAVTPVHALRTALGFGDHHAFDYLWLVLTALALGAIAVRQWSPDVDGLPVRTRSWAFAGLLGVGITGQTLSWNPGPLFYLPIGGYAVLLVLSSLRVHQSPLRSSMGLIGGLALAAVSTYGAHLVFDWAPGSTFSPLAPAALFGGVFVVVVIGELARRAGLGPLLTGGLEFIAGGIALVVAWITLPGFAATITNFRAYLSATGGASIAETVSLFAGSIGATLGPMSYFGLLFFLALPYLLWTTWRVYTEHQPGWLLLVVYTWYFICLSLLQVRFTGPLAPFVATFAGLGFVHVGSRVDVFRPLSFGDDPNRPGAPDRDDQEITTPAVPDRRTALRIGALFLLLGGFGVLQSGIMINKIAIEDDVYGTASGIAEYSEATGLSYPDNYVLSPWSQNRVYNYFVSGESASYFFARTTYPEFASSTDPGSWYRELRARDRAGFVVVPSSAVESSGPTTTARLFDHYGSQDGSVSGVAHYRAIYVSSSGDKKAFHLVPGATITGKAAPGWTVTVSTTVTIPNAEFTYRRVVSATNGTYSVTVPYPGDYSVGNETVTVPEGAVFEGRTVEVAGA